MKTASPAFSLTEVVIALGIATVAVVSVLGLFPVGFDTARESEGDTQAAIMARTIAADLEATVRKPGGSFATAQVVAGKDYADPLSWQTLNLANSGTYWIGFKREIQKEGMMGNPYCLKPSSWLGSANPSGAQSGLDFLAGLSVQPVNTNLSRLELAVEYPATVPQSNRFRQVYTWLMAR